MSSSGAPQAGCSSCPRPSGTGKTTLVERLVQATPRLRMSRSYTSRQAREGEADGVDYNFVSRARFEAMIAGDQFLEWAEIFGNLYGTSQVDTERYLAAGDDLVLVIDVQGARKVRRRGLPVVSVFVLPPSFEVLASRLRGRSLDSEEQIQRRLDVARQEVGAFSEYDYVVVNDDSRRVRAAPAGDRPGRAGASRDDAAGHREHRAGLRAGQGPIRSRPGHCGSEVNHGAHRARRQRRHRRLQGSGGGARPPEARPRRRGRDDAQRPAVCRAGDLRGHHTHPVVTSQWTPGANADVEHIALATTVDLLLVAPATANIIGKFANGIADDFLSTLYLATTAPVLHRARR